MTSRRNKGVPAWAFCCGPDDLPPVSLPAACIYLGIDLFSNLSPDLEFGAAPPKLFGSMTLKKIILVLFIFACAAASAYAQAEGKGIDPQNQRVRDSGANRTPAVNGTKQDVGTGRGIDWGKGKTPTLPPTPNPYRFTARRDQIIKAVEDVMRDRKLVLDEAASKPQEGILISQPYTFIRGAVVTQSDLNRYADVPATNSRGWTRGRYTIIVEIQPIDGTSTNVSVNAKIEGRTDGATGAEWTTLRTTGTAEQEFLNALVENVTGAPPPGRPRENP